MPSSSFCAPRSALEGTPTKWRAAALWSRYGPSCRRTARAIAPLRRAVGTGPYTSAARIPRSSAHNGGGTSSLLNPVARSPHRSSLVETSGQQRVQTRPGMTGGAGTPSSIAIAGRSDRPGGVLGSGSRVGRPNSRAPSSQPATRRKHVGDECGLDPACGGAATGDVRAPARLTAGAPKSRSRKALSGAGPALRDRGAAPFRPAAPPQAFRFRAHRPAHFPNGMDGAFRHSRADQRRHPPSRRRAERERKTRRPVGLNSVRGRPNTAWPRHSL